MPTFRRGLLGGLMTGAAMVPLFVQSPLLPVRAEQPSAINDDPFLHGLPEPTPGCREYTASVHNTNYGQVRGKPSGRPLWRLISGSNVCSKDINTAERNIPWIWVQFKSQEEPWDHEGYMSFRILEPFASEAVAATATPVLPAQQETKNLQVQLTPGPADSPAVSADSCDKLAMKTEIKNPADDRRNPCYPYCSTRGFLTGTELVYKALVISCADQRGRRVREQIEQQIKESSDGFPLLDISTYCDLLLEVT
jgi:hypothetical protein